MLTLGSTPIASFALIPRLLGAFTLSHPGVTVAIREMLTGGHSADESPYFRDLVTGLVQDASVEPDLVQHTGLAHGIVATVSAGMGMALVPQSITRMAFENVRHVSMKLPPDAVARFVLAWRADTDDPVLRDFVDLATRRTDPKGG